MAHKKGANALAVVPLSGQEKEKTDNKKVRDDYFLVIDLYEKQYKTWETRGLKTEKRYRDERPEKQNQEASAAGKSKYNILWSNIQTILPNIFARLPKPEVSRRYKDKDPVGRVASLMLERALEYEIENADDYASAVRNVVEDRLLPGRGVAFVNYIPQMKKAELPSLEQVQKPAQVPVPGGSQELPTTDAPGTAVSRETQISEDTQAAEQVDVIDYESCPVDYVAWRDFGLNVARTWEEVHVIWRKVPLTKAELIKRFGKDIGEKVPLNMKNTGDNKENSIITPEDEASMKGIVYEVWDKKKRKVAWLSRQYEYCMDYQDEPLNLDGFWPCPKPLYATTTTSSLIPVPDFAMYQDQVDELDILSQRIAGLGEALKIAGVYDSGQTEIKRMFNEGVNATMVPVENWLIFAEKGGIRGSIEWFPLEQVVLALNAAYTARDQAKQVIYEIMGISDILRGASDPRETLGAQQIKGQFASKRLKFMQGSVATFATGLLKIKAQIICKHYQDDTIIRISGAKQLPETDHEHIDAALALLRDDSMSDFRIEVSSDSLIEMDEAKEKKDRMEFLVALSKFIDKAIKAPKSLGPLLGELLLFGVRGFKVGKVVEGQIQETIEKLREEAEQGQEQPKDPNEIRAGVDQAKIQSETQIAQGKTQAQSTLDQNKLVAEQEMNKIKEQNSQALLLAKVQSEQQLKEYQARLNKELAIEKATIEAQAKQDLTGLEGKLTDKGIELEVTKRNVSSNETIIAPLQEAIAALTGLLAQQIQMNQVGTVKRRKATKLPDGWDIVETTENAR